MLIKTGLRALGKVNTVDLVGLLVVLGNNSGTSESLLNSVIAVLVAPLSILSDFIHVLQYCVCPDDLETHINVEQTTLLFHNQPRVEARPHLNVMSIKTVSV